MNINLIRSLFTPAGVILAAGVLSAIDAGKKILADSPEAGKQSGKASPAEGKTEGKPRK